MSSNQNKLSINGNTLKTIAIITMFIDHLTYVFAETYMLPKISSSYIGGADLTYTAKDFNLWITIDLIGRGLGRLAFPIFLFLMLEGFLHTRNVWKYALRLGIFALVSEVPFDLAFNGSCFDISYQNVFFTLLVGLLMMIGFELVSDHVPEKIAASQRKTMFYTAGLQTLVFLAALIIVHFLKSDYTYMGIAMAAAIYFTRNHPKKMWIAVMVAMLITMIPSHSNPLELIGCFSFFLIACYNGERGNFNLKYFFYLFYPVHLLILGLIRMFILN
ncbi:MAG: conjugal transfer protein TraX [Lachnospiraceae bacterium]|nr:conjugal transfer protein TraX [Lachnospiraceae bacterium]